MNYKIIVSLIMLFSFVSINSAHAYIDPNTGGFFFQTVAPFVFAMLGAIVILWKRIVAFFKCLFGKKEKENSTGDS